MKNRLLVYDNVGARHGLCGFVRHESCRRGKGTFDIQNMEPWYWISGMIGVGVVICLVQATRLLGATFAISIVMTSQLGFALLWDSLGWLGLEKVPFTGNQLIGVLVIVGVY